MNAIQEKCRPKHQVLILKCYPRTTKGAVDVKPNSSELSYLLFYATSRRSKIQKIGAFLEKKTASDVWRMRIGNVQVTLGILAALVEKSPKDAVLIAPVVLKILNLVLRSNDVTMIESSLPTWEAFCEHHDQSSLFGDLAYLQQYQDVVRAYADLASTEQPQTRKGADPRPIQTRRRVAGIRAIKSIAAADALSSVAGRQIDIIMPRILETLWANDEEALEVLVQRLGGDEKEDSVPIMRRRTSISTVRTADTVDGAANPVAFSGTANDADKLAEEELSVEALGCLRSIFVLPNRTQVYAATNALVKFIHARVSEGSSVVGHRRDSGWGPQIFNIVARWAPVQDRYIILVTALDSLTRSQMTEPNLGQHVVLVSMIGSLLRSDINLIGLSVMDVLLGLIRQMRKLFALQHPRGSSPSQSLNEVADTDTDLPVKKELLLELETCAADLANHVYYADQVSDMISTILGRLKPTRSGSSTSTPPQAEKVGGANGGPTTSSLDDFGGDQSQFENYFSYRSGRISALRVVKQILMVANPKTKISGNIDLSRNRVPSHVWEGSHWLLRDPDGPVRKAYAEAIITWLDRETTGLDGRAQEELTARSRAARRTREHSVASAARRALSSSSHREHVGGGGGAGAGAGRRSLFLSMLHLCIYDNALQFVEYDNDIVLLHVLLTKLVFKLGVNAARYGVPMIYQLQEDIQEVEAPLHKVRIAALCHGYFWALTEKFDFEDSSIGRAIHIEVDRRRSKGFWVEGVSVPAPSISQVGLPGRVGPSPSWDLATLEREEILPFDERMTLVQCIATAYEESGRARSRPQSPVGSPRRETLNPLGSNATTAHSSSLLPMDCGDTELPSRVREQLLAEFSREAVVAALDAEAKAESLAGSRNGTTIATPRHRLGINTHGHYSNGHLPSPFGSQRGARPQSSSHAGGDRDKLGIFASGRKTSVRSAVVPGTANTASGRSRGAGAGAASSTNGTDKSGIASVEQLKMILSGSASAAAFSPMDDDSGDSMVSYESPSEASFQPPAHGTDSATSPTTTNTTNYPSQRSDGGDVAPEEEITEKGIGREEIEEEESVPPVPAIPKSLSFRMADSLNEVSVQDYASRSGTAHAAHKRNNVVSRGGDSLRKSYHSSHFGKDDGFAGASARTMDLQELLRGIDSRDEEGNLGHLTKPPY